MRESVQAILQGSASALLFAAFAVVAGFLVGWPTPDVLSAGIIAFALGFALEHFLRRHYALAALFILGGLALVGYTIRPDMDLGKAITSSVGEDGDAVASPTGSGDRESSRGKGDDQRHRARARRPEPAALGGGEASDTVPTTAVIHNPASVPITVTYEYPGGSLPLGSVGPGATAVFAIPLQAPLELGTFTGRAGDRTVRTHALMRPRRTHQIELPSVD